LEPRQEVRVRQHLHGAATRLDLRTRRCREGVRADREAADLAGAEHFTGASPRRTMPRARRGRGELVAVV
jgi:hypothetical protein